MKQQPTEGNMAYMQEAEVITYLEGLLSRNLDWPEARERDQMAAVVSCMDGRLTRFLRPFSHVIRTAGAVAEPVEGSIGIASGLTSVTLLATHGDCLAYRQALQYLADSHAGRTADSHLVTNLNRSDTRALLTYINMQRPLGALPSPNDQKALAELAISYAVQWSTANTGDKPRIGLFIDLAAALASEPQVWVVSYNQHAGPQLGRFLHARGMSPPVISAHVFAEELGKSYRSTTTSAIMWL